MLCDETNVTETSHVRFFIYGGLILGAEQVRTLADGIEGIRQEQGFRPQDDLKWRTATRPRHVDVDDWNATKEMVLHLCQYVEAKFIACVVLHAIAKGRKDNLVPWQLDHVVAVFNNHLKSTDDVGLVIIDRVGDGKEYGLIRSRFENG